MRDDPELDGAGASSSPAWRVRPATPLDVTEIDAMIHELAEYEREPEAAQATPADLDAALFAAGSGVRAFVVEVPSGGPGSGTWQVCGAAVWFLTYSTWTGRPGIWLEDLYVRPAARGRGLGSALLSALAAECLEKDYRRLEWSVLDWNTSAQSVYRATGAAPHDGWSTWRLDGAGLAALASTAGTRAGR